MFLFLTVYSIRDNSELGRCDAEDPRPWFLGCSGDFLVLVFSREIQNPENDVVKFRVWRSRVRHFQDSSMLNISDVYSDVDGCSLSVFLIVLALA